MMKLLALSIIFSCLVGCDQSNELAFFEEQIRSLELEVEEKDARIYELSNMIEKVEREVDLAKFSLKELDGILSNMEGSNWKESKNEIEGYASYIETHLRDAELELSHY